MSEELNLSPMFLLVKENPATETEQGSFQIAVASNMDAVNGFSSAGFRVFKLNEYKLDREYFQPQIVEIVDAEPIV